MCRGYYTRTTLAAWDWRDARTGQPIFTIPSVRAATSGGDAGEGPGRGVAFNIDPRYPGAETRAVGAGMTGMYSATGERISERRPRSCNFAAYWDGDFLQELLDQNTVSKWHAETGTETVLLHAQDCTMFSVLPEPLHEDRHPLRAKAPRAALRVVEVRQHHAAQGHRPHGPRANPARDIRLGAPAGRQGELQRLHGPAPLHGHDHLPAFSESVQHPGKIRDRNEWLARHGHQVIPHLETRRGRRRPHGHRSHPGRVIRGQRQADGFRRRHRKDVRQRHRLAPVAMPGPKRLADLMAVHAALHHLTTPIQLATVALRQARNLHGRGKRHRGTLLARQRSAVGRIAAMQFQRRLEGPPVADRLTRLGVNLMGPRTIAAVERAVAVADQR